MSAAQLYHVRSPRFVLLATDHRLLRFATTQTRGVSSVTKVLNLSETGLAFEIHRDDSPSEGDVLKVEFRPPRASQIACFATVVRVEPQASPSTDDISPFRVIDGASDGSNESSASAMHLVGLQFRNLPSAYRKLIAQGLRDRVHDEVILDWTNLRRKQHAMFAGLCFAMGALLFVMATPCETWIQTIRVLF